MATSEPLRIVLLGKTGSGKSTLGNTIFGKDVFEVCGDPNSCTKACRDITQQVNGRNIKLIDTPGIFDTDPESTESSPELLNCIGECAPGPHAFLLVLSVGKYTEQEQDVVETILKYFSEEVLKYTTVVFTHGDDLPDETKIGDWAIKNTALKKLIQKCGGRCHVFDNKHWNNSKDEYRNNKVQIKNLIKTIEETVRKNGGYYTNELLQKVATDQSFLVTLAGVSTGVLLGALLGVPVCVLYVIKYAKDAVVCVGNVVARAVVGGCAGTAAGAAVSGGVVGGGVVGDAVVGGGAGVRGAALGAAVAGGVAAGVVLSGAGVGGWKGYKAAEQAETAGEAAEKVWEEVKDFLTEIKNDICSQHKYQKLE